jgi:membrane protein implicated in regulation of membrane protease activity
MGRTVLSIAGILLAIWLAFMVIGAIFVSVSPFLLVVLLAPSAVMFAVAGVRGFRRLLRSPIQDFDTEAASTFFDQPTVQPKTVQPGTDRFFSDQSDTDQD